MGSNQIHTVYRTADGTRVPSVTTYLGILNKPALMDWAWQQGVAGLDYRKVRDQAAGTGTLVHFLALCRLKKEEPNLNDYSPSEIESTKVPMEKLEAWLAGRKLKPILMEKALISEKYGYGGTPDFYGYDNKKLVLLDYKTSNAVYDENFHQLSAYKQLLIENGYDEPEECRIIRLSKMPEETYEDRLAGNLEKHFEIFC